jgi:chromosome segregation ATPase
MIQEGSITLSLKDGITLAGIIVAIAGVWWKLDAKVNGFGERANKAEKDATAALAISDKAVLEIQMASTERAEIRDRVSSVETKVDAIKEELSEERLAVMATLHENERAAAERDAQLREKLAQITERIDIQRIVKTVVQEYTRGGANA